MLYDVAVIGGGVNGAGTARDAALRGLRVALLEREDWGAGTTGASTRMIHGGLRYLLYDIPTTRLSSEDAGHIRDIAPHLSFRIPFLWPLYPGSPFFTEAKEALLAAYDRYAQAKHGLRHARLSRAEALAIEPGLSPDTIGALTLDEWGIDVFRLAALNALDAREAGADLFPHTEVTELLRDGAGREVRGVRARDRLDGRTLEIEAAVVVNAAGPWAAQVAALADARVPLRPGKGIHLTFERRIGNFGLILEGLDGRTMFLVPHGAETIVGTTDDDYFGDPARVDLEITRDEVDYVIEAAARAIPQARHWRPLRAWAGVRNTLFERGAPADDLSRRHEIIDHGEKDGVAGLLSIAGGKLASYRIQAEEATDAVIATLARAGDRRAQSAGRAAGGGAEDRGGAAFGPCTTAERPLPGAEPPPDFIALAREIPLPPAALERIWRRLGSRIHAALDGAGPDDLAPVCRSEAVTAAEIRYAVGVEGCRTLEDLRRHAHVGTGSCDGLDCAAPAAHHMAEILRWPPERTRAEIAAFLEQRWIGRRPVLYGANLAAEEVVRGVHRGAG